MAFDYISISLASQKAIIAWLQFTGDFTPFRAYAEALREVAHTSQNAVE